MECEAQKVESSRERIEDSNSKLEGKGNHIKKYSQRLKATARMAVSTLDSEMWGAENEQRTNTTPAWHMHPQPQLEQRGQRKLCRDDEDKRCVKECRVQSEVLISRRDCLCGGVAGVMKRK